MKAAFKKYSKNCSNNELDKSEIIDLSDYENNKNLYPFISKLDINDLKVNLFKNDILNKYLYLLNDPSEWDIFIFNNYKGFYVIKNCLKIFTQYYLTFQSLTKYCQNPYWNNYNIHNYIIDENIILNGNIWELSKNKNEIFDLAKKYLRWSQLGYRFYHDTHTYSLEPHIPLCPELKFIAQIISSILKLDNFQTFNPDMVLINYYAGIGGNISKKKTTSLRPHTDTYELTMDYPIITLSVGLPAIFLVENNNVLQSNFLSVPSPLGDICIMSGPTRTAVHAVPRVICDPIKIPSFDNNYSDIFNILTKKEKEIFMNKKFQIQLENYIKNFRINFSIRQVKP